MEHKAKTGELFIVATPIGNLSDISLRALETLKRVDRIYCEDTRHSRKLLERHAINTPLHTYHEHNGEKVRPILLNQCEEGQHIALISDAGTPLISDPGYKLVHEARQRQIKVTPISGACAAITALSAAGLPSDRFMFVGFLSPKKQARQKALAELTEINATLIFYESPKRVAKMLADAMLVFGETCDAVVARELTKTYEEFRHGTLAELAAHYAAAESIKGEIVVMISAAKVTDEVSDETLKTLLIEALQNLPVKQAAANVAEQTGHSKRDCYQLALTLKNEQ